MEYYSAMKKNEFESVLVKPMKLEPLFRVKKSEREKQRLYINSYMWNLKK